VEPLGEDIRAELRRAGVDSGPGDAVGAWAEAVGAEIARNARPARTQPDGTLVVHVRDAIWGFELTQKAAEISARLPGRPRLRFVPGVLLDEPPPRAAEVPEPTPEQVREAERLAAPIEDDALRRAVAKVIKAALARSPDDRSV
jgi:hypothetical protein